MIQKIIKKHVVISMSNGAVLEGFVDSADEEYVDLFEINNNLVVIRVSDISFARIALATEKPREPEVKEYYAHQEPTQHSSEDFSMALPSKDDNLEGLYRRPTFVRGTKRNDIAE